MDKNTWRFVGVLVFVQLAGLIVPFVLLMPAVTSEFLTADAGILATIKTAVFLLWANAVVTVAIGLAVFPAFREQSQRWAVLFIILSTMWLVMQSIDNAHILSMLSLSRHYVEGGQANSDFYNLLAPEVRATRVWVHYTELLVIDAWMATFYSALLRFRIVPAAVGWFAILAVALHTAGIPLAMFIGYSQVLPLGFSLAVSHVVVGGWLVVKGFLGRESEK